MPSAPDPAPPPPKPRKRWLPRLRFSLRTLVILVLLIGSGMTFVAHWQPWYRVADVMTEKSIGHVEYSADSRHIGIIEDNYGTALAPGAKTRPYALLLLDSQTGALAKRFTEDFPSGFIVENLVLWSPDMKRTGLQFTEAATYCTKARMWDLASGEIVPPEDVAKIVNAPRHNATELMHLWVKDGSVWIWKDGRPVKEVLPSTTVLRAAAQTNGQRLFTLEVDFNIEQHGRRQSSELRIWDLTTGTPLSRLPAFADELTLSNDGNSIIAYSDEYNSVQLFHRRRPEYWWGVAWLPEFWLTVLFAGALGWSVWRDGKSQPSNSPQRT